MIAIDLISSALRGDLDPTLIGFDIDFDAVPLETASDD